MTGAGFSSSQYQICHTSSPQPTLSPRRPITASLAAKDRIWGNDTPCPASGIASVHISGSAIFYLTNLGSYPSGPPPPPRHTPPHRQGRALAPSPRPPARTESAPHPSQNPDAYIVHAPLHAVATTRQYSRSRLQENHPCYHCWRPRRGADHARRFVWIVSNHLRLGNSDASKPRGQGITVPPRS